MIRKRVYAAVAVCLGLVLPCCLQAQDGGAKLFKTNCATCHSDDGSGNSTTGKALKVKDLRSDDVQKMSDADLTEVLNKGHGKMPAFGQKLKTEKIQQLVAYIRTFKKL